MFCYFFSTKIIVLEMKPSEQRISYNTLLLFSSSVAKVRVVGAHTFDRKSLCDRSYEQIFRANRTHIFGVPVPTDVVHRLFWLGLFWNLKISKSATERRLQDHKDRNSRRGTMVGLRLLVATALVLSIPTSEAFYITVSFNQERLKQK